MARIRSLKPEFWSDEKLGPLRPIDRLVFLGLVSNADDAGRLIDNVKMIDAVVFPLTSDTSKKSLDTLARLSRVIRYKDASGQSYIQVRNWDRHQKVDHPSRYVFPAPSDEVLARHSREARDPIPYPLSPIPDHGSPTPDRANASENGAAFEAFWTAYPKKRNKGDAEKAWAQMKCAGLVDEILAALAQAVQTLDWRKDGGKFIPYPATWLRAKGWADEYQVEIDDGPHLTDASRRSLEAAASWVRRKEQQRERDGEICEGDHDLGSHVQD